MGLTSCTGNKKRPREVCASVESVDWYRKICILIRRTDMAHRALSAAYPFSLKEELAKNPELKESDLHILREWCNKQPHLPQVSDQYLMLFLHSNYYQLEPTKNTIENYFTLRTHTPEFFAKRDPIGSKDIREAFQVIGVVPLAKRTPENYVILYGYLIDPEPSHYIFNDSMASSFMLCDLIFQKYGLVKGYIFVANCVGASFGHVSRVSPMGLKKFIYYVQDAMPIRLKSVHFINAPPVINIIFNMAKPFMNKELADLINIHSSMSTVPGYLSADILPQSNEDVKSIQEIRANAIKEMEHKREWFLEEVAKHRVNEALRVGETKSASSLFGVEGSFKKLDID